MRTLWGIQLLGVPRVRRGDGEPRALERKAAALLAYLAVEGPTSRATLAGLLWPNVVDTRARNSLRQLLHRLRSFEGLLGAGADVALQDADCDLAALHTLNRNGETATIAERWGAEPPALLREQHFDDCPDLAEWLEAERARVADIVTRAVEAEAERHEAAGDVRRALDRAQQLLGLDPLSEAAYRRAMRLHYLAGDRGQALETYHRCQQVLKDTFGVAPLPDTEELARAIDAGTVAQRPALTAQTLPVRLRRPPRLVGRERAWARLEDAWQRVRTILVLGEAGIGKTRLLRDFVASKGPHIASTGVPGERNVPYAAVAHRLGDLLRDRPELAPEGWVRTELARILPDLIAPPADLAPIDAEPQKLRLFEAAATVLKRALEGKVALLNDDLHLWDDASFELGAYFISRFADSPAHSLSSARADEFGRDRLREVELAAESGLAEIIELGPLDADSLQELMREVGAEDSVPTGTFLDLSGGNPFYALEFLRSHWQAHAAAGEGADATPDPNAAGVLDARLRRLSAQAHDLLRVRALTGTAYSPELAAAVLETTLGEVRASLDELRRHRLLSPEDEVHELVLAAVTDGTPREARRLWHRRVALHMADFGASPAAVAGQYLAAWQPAAAYPYLLRAAADARAVFALEEARGWQLKAVWAATDDAQRADALLGLDDVVGQRAPVEEADGVLDELERVAARLQEPALLIEAGLRRARWLTRSGDHAGGERLAREALDDAQRLEDAARVERARLTLGDIAYLAGRYDAAQTHFLEATQSAGDAGRLQAFQRLGALEGMRGDVQGALEHHRQALTLARRGNNLPLVASLLNSVGADNERLGAYAAASQHFRRAADVAGRIGDLRTAAIALANAALTHTGGGDLAAALETAERALEAARPLGSDRSVAMAHFVHGYALRRLGRPDRARAALAEAVRTREAAGDVRGALVARFNLAAMGLEEALAPGAAPTAPAPPGPGTDVAAIVADLETLNIPQFLAWCLVELAFLTTDPTTARAHVERALGLEGGEHLTMAAAVATLRAALMTDDAAERRRARAQLVASLNGSTYLETSLAHLLLARSATARDERESHRAEGHRAVAREVGSLGEAARRTRLAYLERRLPT